MKYNMLIPCAGKESGHFPEGTQRRTEGVKITEGSQMPQRCLYPTTMLDLECSIAIQKVNKVNSIRRGK